LNILATLLMMVMLPRMLFAVSAAPEPAAPRVSAPIVVVQWSDIHYGNSRYRPEAWTTARREGLQLHPDILLFTGDQSDNKCSHDEFDRRIRLMGADMKACVETAHCPMLFAVGNNDLRLNYQTDPETLSISLRLYREALGDLDNLDDLGNAVCPQPVGGFTWISLNTLFFSISNRYVGRPDQARRTLDWLEQQIAALPAGRRVVLVMHIPPVADMNNDKLAWRVAEFARFQSIIRASGRDVVIVTGHLHRNEVHAMPDAGANVVPIFVAGSLSGKFDYLPNWRSYRWLLGNDGHLQDVTYRIHYPLHPAYTRDYHFKEPMQAATFTAFVEEMRTDLRRYVDYMDDLYAHCQRMRTTVETPAYRANALEGVWARVPAATH